MIRAGMKKGMKKPPKGMKYARQKNEMPVAGNETLAWVSHFITHLGGNRKLCRQLPRVYHISGRYPSASRNGGALRNGDGHVTG